MLGGSCSCAISVHGILASFVFSSLFRPLTSLFPVDASHSPVSPMIPARTQKQGGRVCYLYGNVSKICRHAGNCREEQPKTHPQKPTVGHRLTKGAPSAKEAIGVQEDERPGPNSKRAARQIRRHCQATAAPCPCVRGIQGG